MSIYPSLAAVRDDGFTPGSWTIREGGTLRGSASCDVNHRVLEVPTANDEVARVVRAHELTHARVSPVYEVLLQVAETGLIPRAIECAEEARVNYIAAAAGFDLDLLTDNSEKSGGEQVAAHGNWGEATCFLIATLGTGGFKPYLAGIKKSRPEWCKPLRLIAKRAMEILSTPPLSVTTSTRLAEYGLPEGFSKVTLPLANLLTRYQDAGIPTTPDELRSFKRGLEANGRVPKTGVFAQLVWLDQPEYRKVDLHGSLRKDRPVVAGASLRYPGRLLSDPHKRVMSRKAPAKGGIVLIDQSGSMDVDAVTIQAFARRHPQALLVGYSHWPASAGSKPNAWILAAKGKVATTAIPGNIGNGIDEPILQWALSHRRSGEPIVWVCDGQLTDSNDHAIAGPLLDHCADLVRKNKVRLVGSLSDVDNALAHPRPLRPSEYHSFGRIGRALLATRK